MADAAGYRRQPRPALPSADPGKDERFHRTLKAEVIGRRNCSDRLAAASAFEAWRQVYNPKRPHEALGLATRLALPAKLPGPFPTGWSRSTTGRELSCEKSKARERSGSPIRSGRSARPLPASRWPCGPPSRTASTTSSFAIHKIRPNSICERPSHEPSLVLVARLGPQVPPAHSAARVLRRSRRNARGPPVG